MWGGMNVSVVKGQKRTSDPIELELQGGEFPGVGVATELYSSVKAVSALNS